MDLEKKREAAKKALIDRESEIIFQLFTDYHGMQLMSEGFIDFLVDEGVLEPFEEEQEEDE
jgi:hypothetical protein